MIVELNAEMARQSAGLPCSSTASGSAPSSSSSLTASSSPLRTAVMSGSSPMPRPLVALDHRPYKQPQAGRNVAYQVRHTAPGAEPGTEHPGVGPLTIGGRSRASSCAEPTG